MTIPIPYAMDYTSWVSGAVLKSVTCEQCGTEYVYRLERTAEGTGTSMLFLDNEGAQGRASERAEAELRRALERGIDLVPCPSCGRYQEHMLPKARRLHRRWMLNTGACLFVGAIPLTLFGTVLNSGLERSRGQGLPLPAFFTLMGLVALAGVGLLVAQFFLSRRYDPNAEDVEARKQRGQDRAVLRSELEKMLQEAPPEGAGPQPS